MTERVRAIIPGEPGNEKRGHMPSDSHTVSEGVIVPAPATSIGGTGVAGGAAAYGEARPRSPASAMRRLLEGNARWSAGKSIHPDSDFAGRQRMANEGQQPFAAILLSLASEPTATDTDRGHATKKARRLAWTLANLGSNRNVREGLRRLRSDRLLTYAEANGSVRRDREHHIRRVVGQRAAIPIKLILCIRGLLVRRRRLELRTR